MAASTTPVDEKYCFANVIDIIDSDDEPNNSQNVGASTTSVSAKSSSVNVIHIIDSDDESDVSHNVLLDREANTKRKRTGNVIMIESESYHDDDNMRNSLTTATLEDDKVVDIPITNRCMSNNSRDESSSDAESSSCSKDSYLQDDQINDEKSDFIRRKKVSRLRLKPQGKCVSKILKPQKKHKIKWESEVEMRADFGKDPVLCMKAVCVLFRHQTSEEQMNFVTLSPEGRGLSSCDASRNFLIDGNPYGGLKKTVEELQKFDSDGVETCRTLAFILLKTTT
ncbi:hypothetical protein MTR_1g028850 [Medicago truncatula]|uniref:Uncharacterized protein n=1 Tax=Medicago truncatula TaxID=3880 RepID=A0A072VF83_MEDTR|nr:hypothetical protein MTR_1g028850 [Medicago truncatula]